MANVASISQLKANLARYLRAVQRGGEIQILHRGVPIARLSPVRSIAGDARVARLVEAGVVRPRHRRTRELLETSRPLTLTGVELSAALQDERGDRV